jgi:hypothetical protein
MASSRGVAVHATAMRAREGEHRRGKCGVCAAGAVSVSVSVSVWIQWDTGRGVSRTERLVRRPGPGGGDPPDVGAHRIAIRWASSEHGGATCRAHTQHADCRAGAVSAELALRCLSPLELWVCPSRRWNTDCSRRRARLEPVAKTAWGQFRGRAVVPFSYECVHLRNSSTLRGVIV